MTAPANTRVYGSLKTSFMRPVSISTRTLELPKRNIRLNRSMARNSLIWMNSRSEEHTSELQSLMRISYAVFCLKKKTKQKKSNTYTKSTYNQDNLIKTIRAHK